MNTQTLVQSAIEQALAGNSNLNEHPDRESGPLTVTGFCPPFMRHLINNLCDWPASLRGKRTIEYLEIGSLRGATMVAAGYGNRVRVTGLDDFSQFRGRDGNRDNCGELHKNCGAYLQNVWQLVQAKFQDVPLGHPIPETLDVLYLDADHDSQPTYDACVKFAPLLRPGGILIQDDYSAPEVAEGFDRAIDGFGVQSRTTLRRFGNQEATYGYDGDLVVCVLD